MKEGGRGEHLGATTKTVALDMEPNRDDRKPTTLAPTVLRVQEHLASHRVPFNRTFSSVHCRNCI